MAYVTANLQRIAQGAGGGGPSLWIYNGTDAHATVEGTDFFSDGDAKGMKVGDHVILGKTTTTYESVLTYVKTVTAGGAATVAAAILA